MQEERIKDDVQVIKLPSTFVEEDRGYKECCEPQLVLASLSSVDSWKNDITPAWIKLYNMGDSGIIVLKRDGEDAIYQPTTMYFPNDQYSIYVEVDWKSVLAIDGIGCYTIERTWSISNIEGSDIWGEYELLHYSVENALGTTRLRAVFNHYHEIEDINFKGANVNGTIRFAGFIGNRQPNKYIDNLISSDRIVTSNIIENLYTYEMKTDPLKENTTSLITDLYLLSGVELFASDYNWFNHSYRIQDIPVVLPETEELEYKEFNRGANINAKLAEKVNDNRTFYS